MFVYISRQSGFGIIVSISKRHMGMSSIESVVCTNVSH